MRSGALAAAAAAAAAGAAAVLAAPSAYLNTQMRSAPVALWRLTEASGSASFADSAGMHPLSPAGAVEIMPMPSDGAVPPTQAAVLGAGAHLETPFDAELNAGEFSVAAWVKIDDPSIDGQAVISSYDEASNTGYELVCAKSDPADAACKFEFSVAVSPTAAGVEAGAEAGVFAAKPGVAAEAGAWYFVSGQYASGSVSAHVFAGDGLPISKDETAILFAHPTNGLVDSSAVPSEPLYSFAPNTGAAPFALGSGDFQGAVAGPSVYAYGLSDGQVLDHYNAGRATITPPPGDSVDDAIEIPASALPFADSRDTRVYVDSNSREGCEFQDPTMHASPDVAYVMRPDRPMVVTFSLCGAGFDAVMYLTRADGSSAVDEACSDDGGACGGFGAEIKDAALAAGETYYLIVDGYGAGEAGAFDLTVSEAPEASLPGAEFVSFFSAVDAESGAWGDWSWATTPGAAEGEYELGAFGGLRFRSDVPFKASSVAQMWVRSPSGAVDLLASGDAGTVRAALPPAADWTFVSIDLGGNPATSLRFLGLVNTGEEPVPVHVRGMAVLTPSAAGPSQAGLYPAEEEPQGDSALYVTSLIYAESVQDAWAVAGAAPDTGLSHSGAASLRAQGVQAGGEVSFTPASGAAPLAGHLVAWVLAGDGAFSALELRAAGAGARPLSAYLTGLEEGGFRQVLAPLADFRVEGVTEAAALAIVNTGSAPVDMLIDDVAVVSKAVTASAPFAPDEGDEPGAQTPPPEDGLVAIFSTSQTLVSGGAYAGGWSDQGWGATTAPAAGGERIAVTADKWGAFSTACFGECTPIDVGADDRLVLDVAGDLDTLFLELLHEPQNGQTVSSGHLRLADLYDEETGKIVVPLSVHAADLGTITRVTILATEAQSFSVGDIESRAITGYAAPPPPEPKSPPPAADDQPAPSVSSPPPPSVGDQDGEPGEEPEEPAEPGTPTPPDDSEPTPPSDGTPPAADDDDGGDEPGSPSDGTPSDPTPSPPPAGQVFPSPPPSTDGLDSPIFPSPPPADGGDSGLSGGAIAGIVVGSVVGVAIIAGVAYLVVSKSGAEGGGMAASAV